MPSASTNYLSLASVLICSIFALRSHLSQISKVFLSATSIVISTTDIDVTPANTYAIVIFTAIKAKIKPCEFDYFSSFSVAKNKTTSRVGIGFYAGFPYATLAHISAGIHRINIKKHNHHAIKD